MRFLNINQNDKDENELKGLCVTVRELINQQHYLPYLAVSDNRMTSDRAGDVQSAFKGRGMEFDEVRAYTMNDDVRYIDWRVTARKTEPFTKVYHEEKDREMIVLLDMSSSMLFGTRKELKVVAAAKLAALIGWLSLKNKDRFGLLLYDGKNSVYYKPQNSIHHLMDLFHVMADKSKKVLQQSYNGNISVALKFFELRHKGKGTFFILSDFYKVDQETFKNIATLARRHRIYCVNIFDVLEENAPMQGIYAAQNGTLKTIFDSDSSKFQSEYQRYFANQRAFLKNSCQKFSCKYVEIRTDKPIFKQLGRI